MRKLAFLPAGAAVAIAVLAPSHALGFALQVSPIPIVISGRANSALVDITNDSSEPLRVQATAFDWSQSATGEDALVPTTDVLVFPSIVRVEPKSTRKVRVGTQSGYGAAEKSFRVIFAELPEDASPAQGSGETVKVVARMSIPLFVRPTGATGVPKIENVNLTSDVAHFVVRNSGSAHVLVQKIRLEFRGADGKPTSSKEAAGWYVLPNHIRSFDIPIGKDISCAGAKSLLITATTRESGVASLSVDNPPCAK